MWTPRQHLMTRARRHRQKNCCFLNFTIARILAYVLQYAREEKGLCVRAPQKSPRPPRRPHEVKPRPQTRPFTRVRPVRSSRGFLLKLSGTKGGTYASKKCYSGTDRGTSPPAAVLAGPGHRRVRADHRVFGSWPWSITTKY